MKEAFSIIIPVFNEESIIQESLHQLFRNLKQSFRKAVYEVIVSENGSTDRTNTVLIKLQKKYKNIRVAHPEYRNCL